METGRSCCIFSLGTVLGSFSIAMVKHSDQNQLGEESCFFDLQVLITVHH